jgi:hypothetical protein
VIGLNLCPFAEHPYRGNRVRFFVSERRSASGLLQDLHSELLLLKASDPRECETSLLIHPWVLNDFIEYNEFLDIENYTNRSPFPTLHLLREASVERAVAAAGDTAQIYEKNMRTLRALGHAGWQLLWRD